MAGIPLFQQEIYIYTHLQSGSIFHCQVCYFLFFYKHPRSKNSQNCCGWFWSTGCRRKLAVGAPQNPRWTSSSVDLTVIHHDDTVDGRNPANQMMWYIYGFLRHPFIVYLDGAWWWATWAKDDHFSTKWRTTGSELSTSQFPQLEFWLWNRFSWKLKQVLIGTYLGNSCR